MVTKNAAMSAVLLKPVFCIVLGDGDRWSVEAEWPEVQSSVLIRLGPMSMLRIG
jgi:hypothetical protein